MKRSTFLCILPAIWLTALPARAGDRPNYDAYFDRAAAPSIAAPERLAKVAPDGFASAVDARRGVPSFIWAGAGRPMSPLATAGSTEAVARWYVGAYAHRWDLPASIADSLELGHVHDTGRGGIIVTFRQRANGLEIFHGDLKVLMTRSFEVVALAGSPRLGKAEVKGKGVAFKLGARDAIAAAMNDLYALGLGPSQLMPMKKTVADYLYFDLVHTPAVANIRLTEPFRVKRVLFQMPGRLVAGYFLEVFAREAGSAEGDAYAYVVAADDGRVLFRQSLTAHDAFNYRVWADPDGRPTDGPTSDITPHPTGLPDGTSASFTSPILISMEGFNSNPFNQPDPWLAPGAAETLGNNVDAYTDDDAPDGFSAGDLRAAPTSPKTFDRVYDLASDPRASADQRMAATTQLFYVTNWLHDRFYDSGFNEAAGNAQASNFGRGGLGSDVLHAEAQNNAGIGGGNTSNMTVPADGASPRMQISLWSGLSQSSVTLLPGTTLGSNVASWGPSIFDVTADVVVGDDGSLAVVSGPAGVATTSDGCQPLVNNVAGKIVLLDRGNCGFPAKAENAQSAGAVGVLIANNVTQPNAAAPSMGGAPAFPITIAASSTTYGDANTLKSAIQAGPTQVRLYRLTESDRDGSVDSTVVAHEWGHYLHHRLETCGLRQCAGMSEGWGDFTALQMVVRPGDDLHGTFALDTYSAVAFSADPAYFGKRRAPYTTDMAKNGLTFKHIASGVALPSQPLAEGGGPINAEVHNVGEIWASALFEGYVSLLEASQGPSPRYTFEQARRLMNDYVVAAMKLTPNEADFSEQRDALLAITYAFEPLDMELFAAAFAKRGLGSCAVSPPKDTLDMSGAVESFVTQGNFAVLSVKLDDSVTSCDGDGALDADEVGMVTVTVMNTSATTLTATTVAVSTSTPGVTFPAGASVMMPAIKPFATASALIQVALDGSVNTVEVLDLSTLVTQPDSCKGSVTVDSPHRVNYDDVAGAAKVDDVESNLLAWTATGPEAAKVWARAGADDTNHVWHGVDFASLSDSSLESPPLQVSAVDPLVISFVHRYRFEQSAGQNWDGGVLELSTDGGMVWQDIGVYVDPGYGGVITDEASNPLETRSAFVGASAAYPATEPYTLDLGTQLAGKTVKVRFRLGSDEAVGDFGWEIDTLAFSGIVNTPFPAVIGDLAQCNQAPTANAGPDQAVPGGTNVNLDGSASSDPDNDSLTYGWTQTAGPAVAIIAPDAQKPTFLAPEVVAEATLTFQLEVSDGVAVATDTVDVLIQVAMMGTGGAGGAGGAGGGTGGMGGTGGAGGGGGTGGTGGTGGGSDTTTSTGASTTTVASSASASSGDGTTTSGGGATSDAGCDCTTGGMAGGNGGGLGVGVLGALMLFTRRRRWFGRPS